MEVHFEAVGMEVHFEDIVTGLGPVAVHADVVVVDGDVFVAEVAGDGSLDHGFSF